MSYHDQDFEPLMPTAGPSGPQWTALTTTAASETQHHGSSASTNKWSKNGYGAPVNKQSGKFTKQESEVVRKAISDYCAAKGISTARLCAECDHKSEFKGAWMEIAKQLPHRSVQSVYRHGIRQMHPFKRGQWQDSELRMLLQEVATNGKKWSLIQNKLQRSADSCRDKYREFSENFVKGRWKEGETEALLEQIRHHMAVDSSVDVVTLGKMVREGNIQLPWSIISKNIHKRSRLSCFKKWQKMTGALQEDEDEDNVYKRKQPEQFDDLDVEPVAVGHNKRNKMFHVYDDVDDNDMYTTARIADETVEAVGLPDADALDV